MNFGSLLICGILLYFSQIRDQSLHLQPTVPRLSVLDLYYIVPVCHLSPRLDRPTCHPSPHHALPYPTYSTAAAAAQRYPSIFPSHGNYQQRKTGRLIRLGQYHATYKLGQGNRHILTNRTHRNYSSSSTRRSTLSERIFETSKQTAVGESELQASVLLCLAWTCTIQPTPDSAEDPTIGQQREAQGRQSAKSADLRTSPDPVVGLGSPTTDARIPRSVLGASGE